METTYSNSHDETNQIGQIFLDHHQHYAEDELLTKKKFKRVKTVAQLCCKRCGTKPKCVF